MKRTKFVYAILIYAALIYSLSNLCYADEYPKTWYSISIGGVWTENESTIGAIVSWTVNKNYSSRPGIFNTSTLKDCDCNIYRNGTLIETVKVTSEITHYIDTGAKAGEINTYTVVANGLKGADDSNASGTWNFMSLRSVELKNISKTKLEFNSETESESVEIIGIDYQYDQSENKIVSRSLICSWTCPDWITVERYGEEYRIKVNSNETEVDRSGSVRFVIGSNNYLVATVKIEQKAKGVNLFPDVSNAQDVSQVLADFNDADLAMNITTTAEYAAYRDWALGLEGVTAQQVKASPNAWLSFALDTDALIADAPKEGDLKIDGFTQGSSAGVFDLSVSISGITVGDNATAANLAKVFGVEGAGLLDEREFKEANVDIEFGKPDGGKVKIKATPKDMAAKQFFMRVKMKQ